MSVDCFFMREKILVINPDECIDCGVCEPECPIDAIRLIQMKVSKIWING